MLDDPADAAWRRHANPKSGWTRTLVLPIVLYAVYRRNWRLLAASLAFTVLNPVLFSPPETDDAWMTRVVLAERWWIDKRDQGIFALSYPTLLNVLNLPVTGYAILAAWRRNPLGATLACAASLALKFWYVGALVRRYDARSDP